MKYEVTIHVTSKYTVEVQARCKTEAFLLAVKDNLPNKAWSDAERQIIDNHKVDAEKGTAILIQAMEKK